MQSPGHPRPAGQGLLLTRSRARVLFHTAIQRSPGGPTAMASTLPLPSPGMSPPLRHILGSDSPSIAHTQFPVSVSTSGGPTQDSGRGPRDPDRSILASALSCLPVCRGAASTQEEAQAGSLGPTPHRRPALPGAILWLHPRLEAAPLCHRGRQAASGSPACVFQWGICPSVSSTE